MTGVSARELAMRLRGRGAARLRIEADALEAKRPNDAETRIMLREIADDIDQAADALEAPSVGVDDAMVERAWAAMVGEDIAAKCFNASIIRADLRDALTAALRATP